jgi:hypothetical protein
MTERDDRTLAVAASLAGWIAAEGARSAIIGAAALAAHGYARSTRDVDLATELDPAIQMRELAAKARIEDLVLLKLFAGGLKRLADVQALLALHPEVERTPLRARAALFGSSWTSNESWPTMPIHPRSSSSTHHHAGRVSIESTIP